MREGIVWTKRHQDLGTGIDVAFQCIVGSSEALPATWMDSTAG
jgi:hypothetical protein